MSFLNSILNAAATVTSAPANFISDHTPALKTIDLPEGRGSVTIWAAAYELHISRAMVDELDSATDFASAVAGFMGLMVTASGGTLAPAAPIVGAYMTAEWAAVRVQANGNGVRLKGTYIPLLPLVVPTPG